MGDLIHGGCVDDGWAHVTDECVLDAMLDEKWQIAPSVVMATVAAGHSDLSVLISLREAHSRMLGYFCFGWEELGACFWLQSCRAD